MGTHLDEIMVALLKTLAVCVIVGGVFAVPAQLMQTTGTVIYVPVMEKDISAK
jgi:hypothetical protein